MMVCKKIRLSFVTVMVIIFAQLLACNVVMGDTIFDEQILEQRTNYIVECMLSGDLDTIVPYLSQGFKEMQSFDDIKYKWNSTISNLVEIEDIEIVNIGYWDEFANVNVNITFYDNKSLLIMVRYNENLEVEDLFFEKYTQPTPLKLDLFSEEDFEQISNEIVKKLFEGNIEAITANFSQELKEKISVDEVIRELKNLITYELGEIESIVSYPSYYVGAISIEIYFEEARILIYIYYNKNLEIDIFKYYLYLTDEDLLYLQKVSYNIIDYFMFSDFETVFGHFSSDLKSKMSIDNLKFIYDQICEEHELSYYIEIESRDLNIISSEYDIDSKTYGKIEKIFKFEFIVSFEDESKILFNLSYNGQFEITSIMFTAKTNSIVSDLFVENANEVMMLLLSEDDQKLVLAYSSLTVLGKYENYIDLLPNFFDYKVEEIREVVFVNSIYVNQFVEVYVSVIFEDNAYFLLSFIYNQNLELEFFAIFSGDDLSLKIEGFVFSDGEVYE